MRFYLNARFYLVVCLSQRFEFCAHRRYQVTQRKTMSTRSVSSRPYRFGSACFGVSRGLLLIVCVSLFSVELADTRGAARRSQVVRSGRSNAKPQIREDQTFACCLPPNTAAALTTTYKLVASRDSVITNTSYETRQLLQASNGKIAFEEDYTANTSILLFPVHKDDTACTDNCYSIRIYLLSVDKTCYDAIFTLDNESSKVVCSIVVKNPEVIGMDEDGVFTVRSRERYDDVLNATAKFKLVDNGCLPIGASFTSVFTSGLHDDRDTIYTQYQTDVFKILPLEDSYRDLLSLTEDDLKKCQYDQYFDLI